MLADFDLITDSALSQGFENTDGLPVLHGSLANPLTSSGNFCRRLRQTNQNDSGAMFAMLKTTFDGGAWNAPDDTKAISIRFWARYAHIGTERTDRAWSNGVCTRVVPGTAHSEGERFKGYGMRFGRLKGYPANPADDLDLHVGLWARGPTEALASRVDDVVKINPITSSPWQMNTWYRFRFDMIPSGSLAHELKAYVLDGPDLEANYVLLASRIVADAIDLTYTPHAAGQRTGYYYSSSPGPFNDFLPSPYTDDWAFAMEAIP